MTIIAGLDIATRSGLAIFDGPKLIHWEAHRPKGETDAEIFHGFRIWLQPTLCAFGVQYAAIEEPLRTDLKRKQPDGTEVQVTTMRTFLRIYGLRGHAIELCSAMNISCVEVHQMTWRASFLGNGRGKKEDAVKQCKLMGWDIKSKDAAEACGVGFWLAGHLGLTRAAAEPGGLFAPQEQGVAA